MITSRNCAHCETINVIAPGCKNLCRTCGHRCDIARCFCDCPKCKASTTRAIGKLLLAAGKDVEAKSNLIRLDSINVETTAQGLRVIAHEYGSGDEAFELFIPFDALRLLMDCCELAKSQEPLKPSGT